MAGVLRVQFSPLKAFVGGRIGALTLADNSHVYDYLCATGTFAGIPLSLPICSSWTACTASNSASKLPLRVSLLVSIAAHALLSNVLQAWIWVR